MALQEHGAARLILSNTWAWPLNGDLSSEVASRVIGGSVGRALVKRFNLLVDYFIPSAHRRRKISQAELAHYREAMPTPARRHPCAVLPGELIGACEFFTDLAGNLAALQTLPTLIVWADADPIFNDKYRKRLEKIFPNHTTTVLHGVGHFLQSDAPAEFSEAIETWWAGQAGDRAS